LKNPSTLLDFQIFIKRSLLFEFCKKKTLNVLNTSLIQRKFDWFWLKKVDVSKHQIYTIDYFSI